MAPSSAFPIAAVEWLTSDAGSVLAVGTPSFGPATHFNPQLHRLTLVARDPARLAHAPRASAMIAVAAAPDALPFIPCLFDRVVVVDTLHGLPPRLALAEFARVLRPDGGLVVVHTDRDDSVPWVRRLAGIVRQIDPRAMAGTTMSATVSALHDNPYFPMLHRREFRRWVPVARPGLLAMVRRLEGFGTTDPDLAEDVLAEVGALYDQVARVPDPLLLPYTVTCWQGTVDHTELTAPLETDDAGLRIRL
ncbi:MAG: methyltransferase domain-containing protein [Propionibacteriaceae bacterium]|nr:methyltransferase domain-containing protein [Propionibacteriaceae bacterium]